MPPSNNNQSMSDLLKNTSPAGASDPFADVKAEMADRFALLPEELQKVIMGSNYQQQLFDIAKANKMTFEELGTLELETTMVLLGMTRPEEYRDELQVELKKNDTEIDSLVKDVNEKVFGPVRGALERVFAAKKDPADYLAKEPSVSDAPAMKMAPQPAPKPSTTPFTMPTASPAPVAPAPASFTMPTPMSMPTPVAPSAPVVPKPSINTLSDILSPAEKNVLEKTGVILNDSQVVPMAQTESTSSIIAPPTISPERNEMLHDIEFPPKSNPSLMPQMPAKPATPAPAPAPFTMPTAMSMPTPVAMPTASPAPVALTPSATAFTMPTPVVPVAPIAPAQPATNPTPMMGIPPASTSYSKPTDPYREPTN